MSLLGEGDGGKKKLILFLTRAVTPEIYRIVSQKQLSDPDDADGDGNPIRNVETINVKPTVSTDNVRRQCCNQ